MSRTKLDALFDESEEEGVDSLFDEVESEAGGGFLSGQGAGEAIERARRGERLPPERPPVGPGEELRPIYSSDSTGQVDRYMAMKKPREMPSKGQMIGGAIGAGLGFLSPLPGGALLGGLSGSGYASRGLGAVVPSKLTRGTNEQGEMKSFGEALGDEETGLLRKPREMSLEFAKSQWEQATDEEKPYWARVMHTLGAEAGLAGYGTSATLEDPGTLATMGAGPALKMGTKFAPQLKGLGLGIATGQRKVAGRLAEELTGVSEEALVRGGTKEGRAGLEAAAGKQKEIGDELLARIDAASEAMPEQAAVEAALKDMGDISVQSAVDYLNAAKKAPVEGSDLFSHQIALNKKIDEWINVLRGGPEPPNLGAIRTQAGQAVGEARTQSGSLTELSTKAEREAQKAARAAEMASKRSTKAASKAGQIAKTRQTKVPMPIEIVRARDIAKKRLKAMGASEEQTQNIMERFDPENLLDDSMEGIEGYKAFHEELKQAGGPFGEVAELLKRGRGKLAQRREFPGAGLADLEGAKLEARATAERAREAAQKSETLGATSGVRTSEAKAAQEAAKAAEIKYAIADATERFADNQNIDDITRVLQVDHKLAGDELQAALKRAKSRAEKQPPPLKMERSATGYRELRQGVDYTTDFTKEGAGLINEAGKGLRTEMKNALIQKAEATGNPEYVTAMKSWANKIDKLEELKKIIGSNENMRQQRVEQFVSTIFGKNKEYKRQLLKDVEEIIGGDIAEKAKTAALASEFGPKGKAGLLPRQFTGRAGLGVLGAIAAGTMDIPVTGGAIAALFSSPLIASRFTLPVSTKLEKVLLSSGSKLTARSQNALKALLRTRDAAIQMKLLNTMAKDAELTRPAHKVAQSDREPQSDRRFANR